MRKKIIRAALLCLMISQVAGCSENSSGDIKVETTAARVITNTIEVTTPVTEVVEVEDIRMEEITETTETTENTETTETTETPSETQVTESTENMGNEEIIEESFYYTEITDEIKDRIVGKSYPSDVKNAKIGFEELNYLHILYYDFENEVQEGEIICNKAIRDDLLEVFQELYEAKYQLCSVRLVDDFDANDEMSMEANNTSCFNYREIRDTGVLSRHGLGLAIDINPLNNPCVIGDSYEPLTAGEFVDRSKDFDHKIDEDDLAYKLLTEHGFFWGGSWKSVKDYQHFEIPAKK
jgi:hypothetical protein